MAPAFAPLPATWVTVRTVRIGEVYTRAERPIRRAVRVEGVGHVYHIKVLYRSAVGAFWHRISGFLCSEAEARRRKQ